jgi:coatomer protein complex subunit alpha (xenin)
VTGGKFDQAFEAFSGIVCATTLTVVESRQQVGELKELLNICREYLTAIRLELARKGVTEPKRQIELAAYFTHCNLQPTHTMLSLKSAMGVAFKLKLLTSAGSFARRLLELNPRPEFSTQARKVIQLSEQTPGDAFTFEYDERNPFVLCNAELTPIYRGSVSIARCTLCKAAYLPAHVGKKCQTCGLGEVGGEAAGLDETATLSRSHGNLD